MSESGSTSRSDLPTLAQAIQIISRRLGNECLVDLKLSSANKMGWSGPSCAPRECFRNSKGYSGMTASPQLLASTELPPIYYDQDIIQHAAMSDGHATSGQRLLSLPITSGRFKYEKDSGGSENEPKPKPSPNPVDTGYGSRKD